MKKIICAMLCLIMLCACSSVEGFELVNKRTNENSVVIVLDPGHGGDDSGAQVAGVNEKEINFKVANYMRDELKNYSDVEVYLTREEDIKPSLVERAEFAQNCNADILVSLHFNALDSSQVSGAEIFYPNENYIDNYNSVLNYGDVINLSSSLLNNLVNLGLNDRGMLTKNCTDGSTYSDGTSADYYGIIREAKILGVPSVLVEHAYMSNNSDMENFINTDEKLQQLANANVQALVTAFSLK